MDDAVDRLTVGPTRIGLELGHGGQCRRATTEVGVAITSHLLLRYEDAKIERCDRISIIPRGQTPSQVVFHRLDDESYMFGRRPQLLHRLQVFIIVFVKLFFFPVNFFFYVVGVTRSKSCRRSDLRIRYFKGISRLSLRCFMASS